MSVAVPVLRLAHAAGLPLPAYATPGSAGLDLMAATDRPLAVEPGERLVVPTGIAIALPPGFEAQVRPRSGLAWEHGVTVLNAPGTVDSDYRGEIQVLLINHGAKRVTITRGQRIAQLLVAPVSRVVWQERTELGATERGPGGHGSTGSAPLPTSRTATS
ncbi:MAG: dUTP diphosphatase [Proteobacteria bacterium]|nr:dUTP diphosphatase [Pseudomonadota bacterium]MBI3499003.1 dUTP diphosphatase [Pseudomonadota bacterium]